MRIVRWSAGPAALTLAILLGGCAAPAKNQPAVGTPAAGGPDLGCALPSNCVNSLGSGGLAPLSCTGTPAQALAMLQATVATFPEATVVRSDALAMEVIFTTALGFRDEVDFWIDAPAQRVEFRSRSLFGVYDWGKNRARMQALSTRFQQKARP